MSYMSDLDLQRREEEDYFSFYEDGQCACVLGYYKNPHKQGTYAWSEWERGYIEMAKKESRDER